mmetsp:Transcript_61330/g.179249  ORF Transcript_61330/g.179249 Transcript_61330/m.179249 type:complete len:230 (-) Transcript_61330:609-1298(-)
MGSPWLQDPLVLLGHSLYETPIVEQVLSLRDCGQRVLDSFARERELARRPLQGKLIRGFERAQSIALHLCNAGHVLKADCIGVLPWGAWADHAVRSDEVHPGNVVSIRRGAQPEHLSPPSQLGMIDVHLFKVGLERRLRETHVCRQGALLAELSELPAPLLRRRLLREGCTVPGRRRRRVPAAWMVEMVKLDKWLQLGAGDVAIAILVEKLEELMNQCSLGQFISLQWS